jgi:Holliday junction resolvase RusA-like endonuclease
MQDTNTLTIENKRIPIVLLDIELPIPPNTNNVYRTRGGGLGRYMTDEGHAYKAYVARAVRAYNPDFAIPKRTPLVIHFEFWLGTDKLNKNDWDGLVKILQDAIFETGGGNDTWIRRATVTKKPAQQSEDGQPKCWVQLKTQGMEGANGSK